MKKTLLAIALVFACSFVFAYSKEEVEVITFDGGNGTTVTVEVPVDIAKIVNANKDKVNKALQDGEITKSQLETAVDNVKSVYDKLEDEGKTTAPLTKTMNGLDDFSADLAPSIANTQLVQNVWAESWIGTFLFTGFHIGAGINAGVAQMKIGALKDVGKALEIDMGGLPDDLIFPTITADLRLGGIIFPFDAGFTVMKLDSSAFGIEKAIEPVTFDFFTIGFDGRWALMKGDGKLPKISVGAGYMHTKGNIEINDKDAAAGLDFETNQFYLQGQVSKKLLFFIPYAGAKLGFAWSKVDWNAKANWKNIFDGKGNGSEIETLQKGGFLPTNFSGGYDGFNFVPQVYAGFAFDLFVVDLTFDIGYDLANMLASGAFSFRISW